MTDRTRDRDIEATLETWMDQMAPDRAPGRLLEETFARTMTSPQTRRYPWHDVAGRTIGRPWAASRALVLVIVTVLIIVALGAGFGAGGGWFAIQQPSSPSPTASLSPGSPSPSLAYAVIASPSAPFVTTVVPEAAVAVTSPIAMGSDGQGLWVLTEDGSVVKIDPATNDVAATVALDGTPYLYNGLSAGSDGVWATRWSPGLVYRLDPATEKLSATIATENPKGVLDAAGAVWVANTHTGTVSRIDPATNTTVATINVGPTGNSGPNWLASGLGSIWVDVPNASEVVRIDPLTNLVQARIGVTGRPTPCGGLAVGEDAVWVSSCDASDWLTRIDPVTNTVVAIIDLGGRSFGPMFINGNPWVNVDRSVDPASILRIDPATNQPDRLLSPGGDFRGGGDMVVVGGSVWVADYANDRVLRLPLSAFEPG